MIELLNVLYVQTAGAFVRLDHDAVAVDVEHELRLRVPLIRLSAIMVFGRVSVSPALIERCAMDGRALVWLDRRGRFVGKLEGPTRGNVLLRREQHLALGDPVRSLEIARRCVIAKIQNSRLILLRAAREHPDEQPASARLSSAATHLAESVGRAVEAESLNQLRGVEGDAARAYFGVFNHLIRVDREDFAFDSRTRRPPRSRTNALLSFLYALITAECGSALEGVGLDPQVGFLHALRPAKPALALDIVEEFRPIVADRLALRMINRRELRPNDFEEEPGGAFLLTADGRRKVLQAYQLRKEEEVSHQVLARSVPLGLVPHVQARLLARHLRGDLAVYPAFRAR